MTGKVIISCAITGSIHTPSMSPHLPVTAHEIAESALGAAEAGAAIVHLHARAAHDGRPDQSPEAFEPFLKVIKQRSDVVINLTTGGSPYMPVEERVRPAAVWKPEVASINMGSMNFGLFPMITGQSRLQRRFYDEQPALDAVRAVAGQALDADAAFAVGLVTSNPDDIDWADETRIAIEERVAMSPDALTGLEANLRFNGPENMFTRIFGRLTAWQNWIFQRPNAVGEKGALKVYGKGDKAAFDWNRV